MKHLHLLMTIAFSLVIVSFSSLPQLATSKPLRSAFIIQTGGENQRKPPRELESIALRLVAEQQNLQVDELEITNSAIAYYPHSGRKANVFSISHKQRDEDYNIALDDNGHVLDQKKLVEDERVARFAKYGKLSPELAERLKQVSSNEELAVIVLLNLPPDTDRPRGEPMDSEKLKTMTPEERQELNRKDEELEQKRQAYYTARAKRVIDPVVERLKQHGLQFRVIGNTGYIALKLNLAMIKEIERWEEVREIALDGINKQALDVSRPTIGADLVENRGINGSGVMVAQVEVGGRIFNSLGQSNPYLSGATQDNTFICPGQADDHSTAVAGIIRSTATLPPVFRGISPAASLWAGGSCGGFTAELQNQTTSAQNIGARVINHSYQNESGINPTSQDQFLDFRVHVDRRLQVVAAGNQANGCGNGSGRVTSPGKGYNVITVGNYNDRNTVARGDEIMAACSSYVGPGSTNGDRIKPEIVAPGTLIITTLAVQRFGQWFDDQFAGSGLDISGTSFSAPHVSGTAGLLISRAYNTFGINNFHRRCEVMRAIIMASAFHDIEFGTDRDGIGGISASWADDVLSGIFGGWGYRDFTCSDIYPFELATIPLQAGLTTRVVIAWSTNPNYASYNTQPSADLGLRLVLVQRESEVQAPGNS